MSTGYAKAEERDGRPAPSLFPRCTQDATSGVLPEYRAPYPPNTFLSTRKSTNTLSLGAM